MGSLKAKLDKGGDGKFRVALAGAMDEESDLKSFFTELNGDTVFDLGEIERVNSMGIHLWIPQITELSNNHDVLIERIAYPMVLQANTVANLFGKARVTSCYAPYFCGSCHENYMVEVSAEEVVDGTAPEKKCDTCSDDMEFDELDSYFYFLQRQA
jgi:hypothetical protein